MKIAGVIKSSTKLKSKSSKADRNNDNSDEVNNDNNLNYDLTDPCVICP